MTSTSSISASLRCAAILLLFVTCAWSASIEVLRNGSVISATDTVAPSFSGTVAELDYTIRNTGTLTVTLQNLVVIPGTAINCTASIQLQPISQVASGSSTMATLHISPSSPGAWSVPVSFGYGSGQTFAFTIHGNAGAAIPQIALRNPAGATILPGSSSPVDGTEVGMITPFTITILNTGAAPLSISTPITLTGQSNCTVEVATQPATLIQPQPGSTTCSLNILPGPGSWSFEVILASNSNQDNVFPFTVHGSARSPTISITRDGRPVTPGLVDTPFTDTSADAIASVTYRIANTGSADLIVNRYTGDLLPGAIRCAASRYWVNPGGTVSVYFQRVGGNRGIVSVNWATVNGTAVSGADFNNQSGTITWADGDRSDKSVTISTLSRNRSLPFGRTQFSLFLSNATGGATIARPGQAAISIEDSFSPVDASDYPDGLLSFGDRNNCLWAYNTGDAPVPLLHDRGSSLFANNLTYSYEIDPGTSDYVTAGTGTGTYIAPIPPGPIDDDDVHYVTIPIARNPSYGPTDSCNIRIFGVTLPTAGIATDGSDELYEEWMTVYILNTTPQPTAIIGDQLNCTVIAQLPSRIVPSGDGSDLTLNITPLAAGPWQVRVTTDCSDPVNGSTSWIVSGVAGPNAPRIAIDHNGVDVAYAGTDSVTSLAANTTSIITYTIRNANPSTAYLEVSGVVATSTSNCTVGTPLIDGTPLSLGAVRIGAGQHTTLNLPITPSSPGAFNASISIANGDPSKDPFVFTIAGIAGSTPAPDLRWSLAGPASNQLTNPATDIHQGLSIIGVPCQTTYTISNVGTAPLVLSGPNSISTSNCTVSAAVANLTIQAQSSTTVTFSVTPATATAWSFTFSKATNLPGSTPAVITIQGVATPAAPQAVVSRNGSVIAPGSADCPNGLIAGQGSVLSYAISNLGSANLTLTPYPALTAVLTNLGTSTGSGFTDRTIAAGNASTADVPLPGSADSCWYFGVQSSRWFGGLAATLSTSGSSNGRLAWEYYNGAIWADLPLIALAGAEMAAASNIIAWRMPADWTAITLNGIAARWIRARVLNTFTTPPVGTRFGVSPLGNASNCSATMLLPATWTALAGSSPVTITPNQTSSLSVRLIPIVAGACSIDIAIPSNDPNRDPLLFTIAPTALQPATEDPVVQIVRQGISLDNGQVDNLGSTLSGNALMVGYTINNVGPETLSLEDVSITGVSNCAVRLLQTPDQTVLSLHGTQVSFAVTPTVPYQLWSFTWSVATNDPIHDPATITVTGTSTAASGPALVVSRDSGTSSTTIPANGTDSIDGTFTGSAIGVDYRVSSSGTTPLILGVPQITALSNCSAVITQGLPTSVSPGANSLLRLSITPTSAALWSCTVSFGTNVAGTNPMTFSVNGTSTTPVLVPQIRVNASSAIPANSTVPIAGDLPNGIASTLPIPFTVLNTGTGPLSLSDDPATVPSRVIEITSVVGCNASITNPMTTPASVSVNDFDLPTIIPAGGQAQFQLQITPSVAMAAIYGEWTATVKLYSNDPATPVYSWIVAGRAATGNTGPQINITRLGGAVAPSATDLLPDSSTINYSDHLYVVENDGNAPLLFPSNAFAVSGLSNCQAQFVPYGSAFPTTISAGNSAIVTMRIKAVMAADWSCVATITSNDSVTPSFAWNIANATPRRGSMSLSRNGTSITTIDPVGDVFTDDPVVLRYSIVNSGIGVLSITAPSLGSASNCTPIITGSPSPTLQGGQSTSLEVRCTPGAGAWGFTISCSQDDGSGAIPVQWQASGRAAPRPTFDNTIGSGEPKPLGSGSGCGAGALGLLCLVITLPFLRRKATWKPDDSSS